MYLSVVLLKNFRRLHWEPLHVPDTVTIRFSLWFLLYLISEVVFLSLSLSSVLVPDPRAAQPASAERAGGAVLHAAAGARGGVHALAGRHPQGPQAGQHAALGRDGSEDRRLRTGHARQQHRQVRQEVVSRTPH